MPLQVLYSESPEKQTLFLVRRAALLPVILRPFALAGLRLREFEPMEKEVKPSWAF